METLLLEEGNVVQGAIAVDEFEHHHFGLAKLPSDKQRYLKPQQICIGEVHPTGTRQLALFEQGTKRLLACSE